MRVAYVCADPGVPIFGNKGSSVHVQEVVRALIARGDDVEMFATRFDGEAPDDLRNVGIHWLSALPKGDIAARELASFGANCGLHGALKVAGSFDLVYERYSIWSFAGMEYARERGIPGLLEVNAPLIEEQARHRGLVDRSNAERVAERVFAAASAIVVVSSEVASYLEGYASARGKIHIVPNGVNADRFNPDVPPRITREAGSFTVGFVGTLKPWHGLPVLARAFAELRSRQPNARLLIGGDGPEREALEVRLSETDASEAVHFAGPLDPTLIPALLTSMDAAVAPYPAEGDFYFSPLKIYEYMASGLPVVASSIGQISHIIRDGENGLLCPPGDSTAFAAALERLIASPELAARLGEAAREAVEQAHTWPMVVDRIVAIAEDSVASCVGAEDR